MREVFVSQCRSDRVSIGGVDVGRGPTAAPQGLTRCWEVRPDPLVHREAREPPPARSDEHVHCRPCRRCVCDQT